MVSGSSVTSGRCCAYADEASDTAKVAIANALSIDKLSRGAEWIEDAETHLDWTDNSPFWLDSETATGNYFFSINGTAPDASAASRSSGSGLRRRSSR